MPVPQTLYAKVVRAQKPTLHLDRDLLSKSFSDLVISPTLLDSLGPAIHGSGAMFLYGPPGTGKSSIAERVVRAYEDVVVVPHCIEVDNQIVPVRAREATGDERDRLWNEHVAQLPEFGEYPKKTDRVIPMFVLVPRN
jgi:Cdc6-like AAA superfamily ATPase